MIKKITLQNQPVDDPIDLMVRVDKLQLLYHQSFPALFVSVVAAVLLCLLLWQQASAQDLLAWFSAIALCALVRLALFLSYFRANPGGSAVLAWEKPYAITLLVSALVWGVGALIVMPGESLLHQALTFVVLIGMAGGAVSTYSAYRYMAVGSMLLVLLPLTLWLLWQWQPLPFGMAIGALIFIAASLRATKVISQALHRSFQLTHELERANAAAEQMAKTDHLTGLNNRRAFFEHGYQLIQYCQRHQRPFSAMVMDVDHFKHVNDTHGHAVGDAALQHLAQVLMNTFRKSDICGRIGGEEFAIFLPDTPLAAAEALAEKLRQTISEIPLLLQEGELMLTVSIGVASGHHDFETLLQRSDTALYRAKTEGRNRVVCHAPGA